MAGVRARGPPLGRRRPHAREPRAADCGAGGAVGVVRGGGAAQGGCGEEGGGVGGVVLGDGAGDGGVVWGVSCAMLCSGVVWCEEGGG